MKKESVKKRSRVGSFFARRFKFKYWLDFERIKAFFVYMVTSTQSMAKTTEGKAQKTESFMAVAQTLGITEKELSKQGHALLWWSRLLLLVSLLIFGYSMYHLTAGNFRASLTSLLVVMVGFTLAFRYHFLYFQIKSKKLGCTIKEWFREGLIGLHKS